MENVNPIKSDPELRGLLKRLDRIKKYKTFSRWKSKFLRRLESLVFEQGIEPAEKNCNSFSKVIEGTIKCASKVTAFIDKGELSAEKKTVKASLALNELTHDHLTTAVEKIQRLIPSTGREEKQVGFNKFHIGAVLIRQGFHQYITMKRIEDALTAIAEKVEDVADKQQLILFQEYSVCLSRFCDIMADLNLYDVMMKCVEFAEAPEEEESSDEEPLKIEIDVQSPDGSTKTIKLEVEPSDKIESIKNMIAEDIGVAPDKQVIKFKGNELPNNSTIGKAGIKDGLKLSAAPLKIPVIVNTYDGKQIKIMVDPDNYHLSDVKRLLEPESGVSASVQELFLGVQKLSDDKMNVSEHGIEPNTVLYMEPKVITIQAKMPDGTTHDVQVSPSDTPEQVKGKIETKTGMAASIQILKIKGKEVPSEKSLRDMGIRDGDKIQVDASQIPVTVTTKNGKTVEIMVNPNDTVKDIKREIEDKTGVPADQQKICMSDMNGKELADDNKSAVDCGIKAGCTLSLTAKAMKISIELPNGSKHKIEIDAMDSISEIQAQIARTKGLEAFVVAGDSKSGQLLEIQTHKIFATKE